MVFLDHATTGDGLLTALHAARPDAPPPAPRWPSWPPSCSRLPQVLVNVRVARPARGRRRATRSPRGRRREAELGDAGRVLLRPVGHRAARPRDGRGADRRSRPTRSPHGSPRSSPPSAERGAWPGRGRPPRSPGRPTPPVPSGACAASWVTSVPHGARTSSWRACAGWSTAGYDSAGVAVARRRAELGQEGRQARQPREGRSPSTRCRPPPPASGTPAGRPTARRPTATPTRTCPPTARSRSSTTGSSRTSRALRAELEAAGVELALRDRHRGRRAPAGRA